MVSFWEYLSEKWLPLFACLISTSITFGLIYVDIHVVLRRRLRPLRLLAGALLTAVLFHVPQFLADYLFYFPRPGYNVVSDCILLFPCPIYVAAYYWLYKRIFRFPDAEAMRVIEETFIAQYMSMVLFKALSGVWAYALRIPSLWPWVVETEIYSMLSTSLLGVAYMLYIRWDVRRGKRYLEIPYGYPSQGTARNLLRIFASVLSTYVLLVICSTLLFQQGRARIDVGQIVIYAVVFLTLALRMSDGIHKRQFNIMIWREQETNNYIKSLMLANDEFRSVKHDFYNVLQVYDGYIECENLEGLRAYHRSLMNTTTHAGTSIELIRELEGRRAVYTLLDIKLRRAWQEGVRLEIEGAGAIVQVRMNDLDLCRILGNLLDNAIEAAAISPEKAVWMRCAMRNGRIGVTISNTTAEDVDVQRISLRGYTTKGDHSGQGLSSVQSILSLHEGCSIRFEYADHRFEVHSDLQMAS